MGTVTLKDALLSIGLDASAQLPEERTYSSCCGLFIKAHAPAVESRKAVLKLSHWLNLLAEETDERVILATGLLLVQEYLYHHLQQFGQMRDTQTLIKEINKVIDEYDIKFEEYSIDCLNEFCKEEHHVAFLKIIEEDLNALKANSQLTASTVKGLYSLKLEAVLAPCLPRTGP